MFSINRIKITCMCRYVHIILFLVTIIVFTCKYMYNVYILYSLSSIHVFAHISFSISLSVVGCGQAEG